MPNHADRPRPAGHALHLLIFSLTLTAACSSPAQYGIKPIEVRSSIRKDVDVASIKKVAVLPFASPPGEFTVGENVSDMLTTEMLMGGYFDVLERSQIQKLLEEQHLGLTGAVDVQTAQKLGKIVGAQGIVIGSVGEYGRKIAVGLKSGMLSTLSLSAKLVSVETGMIVWSASTSASSEDSRAELQARCVRKLGEDLVQKISGQTNPK